ncbi:MAG: ATP-binding protein, partial [Rectinema sp.]|nr:ATP-binding protein [Rectinema sp.]
ELIASAHAGLYRASMERRLRDSERRYRSLFAYGLAGRCLAQPDGSIIERNQAFSVLVGDEKTIHSLRSMFVEETNWEEICQRTQHGETIQREIRIKDFGRGPRDLLCSFSHFRMDEKDTPVILLECLDITESKRLQEELFQSQKLEAIGKLASGVAHDLNNFMTSMIGYLEMVKLDITAPDAISEDIKGLEQVIQRTSSLTRQLLSFSRKKVYSPQTVDLRDILSSTYRMLSRLLPERIKLVLENTESPCFVHVDPGHLEQMILNLVVNARDAVEKTEFPRITIRLELREAPPQGAVSIGDALPYASPCACIFVEDNGCGMTRQILEKIFDPFFSTKPEGEGTGLGLSIVKSLAELNAIRIFVESTPGKGSVFGICMSPIHAGSPDAAPRDIGQDHEWLKGTDAQRLRGKRILIVDDDSSVLISCARILQRAGADINPCSNAGEALLASENGPFDLLITDVYLASLDGLALFERLVKSGSVRASLFMTGHENANSISDRRLPLLMKPFSPAQLVHACAAALNRENS